jgi:hypothetical protein
MAEPKAKKQKTKASKKKMIDPSREGEIVLA